MPVELDTLIAAVVRAVLDQVEHKPGPVALVLAPRTESLAQREVLELLLQGKQVRTLGFAYRAHTATAPHALLHLYEDYAARLASFGLTELGEAAPTAARVRDCLITANHVTEAAATGARTLRAPQGAVVTPLAQDAAAEHNMTILKDL